MKLFDRKIFNYTFVVVLAISLFAASFIIARYDSFSFASLLLSVGLALCSSTILAAMAACYRYPVRWSLAALREVMRRIAKRAIRASLYQAIERVECTGILEIDDEIALNVQAGRSQGVIEDTQFNVYESTNNQLWGSVVAIKVRETDCDCIVSDRTNAEFWEKLERRMRYNTEKPPSIHLIRELPITYLAELVENLLDAWR